MANNNLKHTVRGLLAGQRLAVLATSRAGAPYGNLMAFAETDDLRGLLFCTTRSTRKFANIEDDRRAAMVVDNRANDTADFHQATAVTAIGRVVECGADEAALFRETFLAKHPYMREFVDSPSCARLRLVVERYVFVSRFQNVEELEISAEATER